MPHIGMICPPMHGHMHPMFSLGRELVRLGHRVTVLALADARAKAEAAGLEFVPIGASAFPPGSISQTVEELGRLSGVPAVRFTLRMIRRECRCQIEDLPAAAKKLGLDLLAVDQTAPAGGSIADVLGLPFVTVCNALMIDQEWGVPPVIAHWSYSPSIWARCRNRLGFLALDLLAGPILRDVNEFRVRYGLRPHARPPDCSSRLATVCQVPAAFDFPRVALRPWFHYAGPFQDPGGREPAAFPYERLDGRPLIYGSFGTLQNRVEKHFRCIAAACAQLPVQLVLGLGGADPVMLQGMPGDALVVRYAPQLELLRRASLTITHAGLNTALESLACGVPMVAIPITNDQPGVAARVEWHEVGERILPGRLTVERLRSSIERVLREPKFRQNAQRLRSEIAGLGGTATAARVIETVLATRAPVLRSDVKEDRR